MSFIDALMKSPVKYRKAFLEEYYRNIDSEGLYFCCPDEFDSIKDIYNLYGKDYSGIAFCSGACERCFKNSLYMEMGEFNGTNFCF